MKFLGIKYYTKDAFKLLIDLQKTGSSVNIFSDRIEFCPSKKLYLYEETVIIYGKSWWGCLRKAFNKCGCNKI